VPTTPELPTSLASPIYPLGHVRHARDDRAPGQAISSSSIPDDASAGNPQRDPLPARPRQRRADFGMPVARRLRRRRELARAAASD
jgi:hypothetical protein